MSKTAPPSSAHDVCPAGAISRAIGFLTKLRDSENGPERGEEMP